MKPHLIMILALAFITVATIESKAQSPADVLKRGSNVTFFGVDFSKCKGVALGVSAEEMRDNYFPAINTLLMVEQNKFDIRKYLMKSDVINTLYDVNKGNQTLDVANFDVYSIKEVKPLSEDTIAKMIEQYDLKDKTGDGLVFIAESLDKTGNFGTYYLVYFTMPEGKVIVSEKVSGKPQGFGVRNYWAYTIYDILKSDLQERLELIHLSKNRK
ncbi:MAG: hypothetical protein HOO86_02825 [Bacteroidales bacterium]|nr:hypothetical protein [Bacteroidales bacterium]